MTEKRCDTCRFWEPNPDVYNEEELRPKVGECLKAKPYWETTEWTRDDNSIWCVRTTKPEFEGLKMFVQDGSDYKATLLTTADFYCAHFEKEG